MLLSGVTVFCHCATSQLLDTLRCSGHTLDSVLCSKRWLSRLARDGILDLRVSHCAVLHPAETARTANTPTAMAAESSAPGCLGKAPRWQHWRQLAPASCSSPYASPELAQETACSALCAAHADVLCGRQLCTLAVHGSSRERQDLR